MTQEEARKRWCPFAAGRALMFTNGKGSLCSATVAHAPHTDANPVMTCMGDDCMAWRWTANPYQNAQPNETGVASGDGYCGLAGAPRP